jgi:hypothetical protein
MGRRLGSFCVATSLMGLMGLVDGAQLAADTGSRASQQPPPATTAQQPPSAQASEGAQTLTGCIRSMRADTTAADAKGNIYTLEVMDTASAGATEVGAPAPGTSGPITYTLSAPDSVGVGKHVGHQVQLTGTLKPPAASAPTAPTTAAPGAKPGSMHRTFEVTALKMISAKCP